MLDRNLSAGLRAALADTPVLLLNGPRQSGKSTLAKALAADAFPDGPAAYVTLDDSVTLSAAIADPAGYIAGFSGPVILDEVQNAPDLFRAVKVEVDRDRRPGRFLMTGSADVFLLPIASESLAGRIEVATLWPLSQGELAGRKDGFVDALFASEAPQAPDSGDADIWSRLAVGGYPEVVSRSNSNRRARWFASYITTMLQRDIRDLSNIEGLTDMPRLLALVAARTGTLLNVAELSRSSGLAASTLKRYLTLLEATFLIRRIPAWSTNRSKRLVRSPKIVVADTGLASNLIGFEPSPGTATAMSERPGQLLETFVAGEITRQLGWSTQRADLFHFRTQRGHEVDFVLESPSGTVVGVEVKASATVSQRDFRGLKALRDERPDGLHRGVILYTGREMVAFGDGLFAVPIQALWEW